MKSIVSALTVLVISVSISFAQGYTFRVLANKGQNQVVRNGKKQPLRTGTTLLAGDEIITNDGSYIGLMHKSGKTLEIRTKGSTKVLELEKKISIGNSSVASRYANYIMARLNEDETGGGKGHHTVATGAAERATGKAITILSKKDVDVLGPEILVRWTTLENATTYSVSVQNIFDDEIYSAETEKGRFKLNLNDENFAEEELLIVTVHNKDNEEETSNEVGIKKLDEERAAAVKADLQSLKAEVSDDSPISKLVYASFFEDKGLILDAITQYEAAVQMAPEVKDFQVLYSDFLVRNGLAAAEVTE